MRSFLSNLSFTTKGLILVAVPVAFELVFALFLTFYVVNETSRLRQIQESKVLIRLIQRSHGAISRAFLIFYYSPRSREIRAGEAEKIAQEIRKEGRWEQRVQLENVGPELAELVREVRAMKGTVLALTDELKEAARGPQSEQKMYNLALTLIPAITDAKDIYRRLLEKETRMREETSDRIGRKATIIAIVAVGLVLGIGVSTSILYLFTSSLIFRLGKTADRARAIALGKPIPPVEYGLDEIADLDRALANAAARLKEIRQRESAILDGVGDLILSLDSRLRIKTIGETCERHWGFSKEILLGRSVLTLLDPDYREEFRSAFERIAETELEGRLETSISRADGSPGVFLWSINWSASKRHYFCIARDISEARRIERLRQYFLSMAGHDLRSPLTAVSMDLQMIAAGIRGPLPAEFATEVEEMDRKLAKLIGFVNELLDLEKLEAHRMPLSLSAVSAGSVCESALENLSSSMEQSGSSIRLPEDDLLLLADEAKLEKGLEGLFSSCTRMARGESVLEVRLDRLEDKGMISVRVPGLHVPHNEREAIFNKLRSASPGTDPDRAASPGLGLAIARAVAIMHGGEATMTDGSTLSLTFPLYEGDDDDSLQGQTEHRERVE